LYKTIGTSFFFALIVAFLLRSSIIITSCSTKSDLPKGSNLIKFGSTVWQENNSFVPDDKGISERQKMLKDLVENVLPKKTEDEIEKLLGTPYEKSINGDLIYYLGPERDSYFGNIDSECLLICLDKSSMFKKYEIVND